MSDALNAMKENKLLMSERLRNTTISKLITELQAFQKRYGDLPVCSEGNPPDSTTVEITAIDDESIAAPLDNPKKATMAFIQLW